MQGLSDDLLWLSEWLVRMLDVVPEHISFKRIVRALSHVTRLHRLYVLDVDLKLLCEPLREAVFSDNALFVFRELGWRGFVS